MARLTPISRERLIRRHLDEGVPLKALAAEAGISLRSAYKWLALSFRRAIGLGGSTECSPPPAAALDPQQLQQAVDLRYQPCTPLGGGHWSLVVGWDPATRQVLMHDPYGEADLVAGGYVSTAIGSGKAQRYSERNWGRRWMAEGEGSGWWLELGG